MEVITPAPRRFHSTAAATQAGFDTMKPAARPHLRTLWRITAAGPARCHTETQTSGNKNGACLQGGRELLDIFCSVVFTRYSIGRHFTVLECIAQFLWDLLESSLLALLR